MNNGRICIYSTVGGPHTKRDSTRESQKEMQYVHKNDNAKEVNLELRQLDSSTKEQEQQRA